MSDDYATLDREPDGVTCRLSAPGCAPLRLANAMTAYSVKAMVEAAYHAGRADTGRKPAAPLSELAARYRCLYGYAWSPSIDTLLLLEVLAGVADDTAARCGQRVAESRSYCVRKNGHEGRHSSLTSDRDK